MLDPDKAHAWVKHHFATVTPEEFAAGVKRADPDLYREIWGDRPATETNVRPQGLRRARGVFASLGRSVLRLFS